MPQVAGARKARNSIPKIDPDPRPVGYQHSGVGKATAVKTKATTTAQPTNTPAPATQSEPMDPFKATAAPRSNDPFALPSYTPQNGQPDPRDATYWANVSKLSFSGRNDFAQALYGQSVADTDFSTSLREAIQARKGQQRGLGENAIRSNLGASGWLNRNEAEQTTQYLNERGDATAAKTRDDQERARIRQAIIGGYQLDSGSELTDAGGRYLEGAQNSAATDEPLVGLSGASGGNKAKPKAKPAAKVAIGKAMVAKGGKKKGKK